MLEELWALLIVHEMNSMVIIFAPSVLKLHRKNILVKGRAYYVLNNNCSHEDNNIVGMQEIL